MTGYQRWNRLIEILESVGYVYQPIAKPDQLRTFTFRDSWHGVGSSYMTLTRPSVNNPDADLEITIRMSDHAQKPNGGMRYSELMGCHEPAGESDISIHPHGSVTLHNILTAIEVAFQRQERQMAEIEALS